MHLRLDEDSEALYNVLGDVSRLYYQTYQKGGVTLDSPWIDKMINCVAKSAFFNTQRMMQEYNARMWRLNV